MSLTFPLTFNVPLYARGDYGVPSATGPAGGSGSGTWTTPLIGDLAPWMTSLEFSISDKFGFESATLELLVPREIASEALTSWLMTSTVIRDRHGITCWEGFVSAIEATIDGDTRTIKLDDVATNVIGRITQTDGTVTTVSGGRNQYLYGRKDYTLNLPKGLVNPGIAINTEINRRGYPVVTSSPSLATGGGAPSPARLRLTFAGWYWALAWVSVSSTSTTSTRAATQITNLLTAYNAINNFFSSDFSNVYTAAGTNSTSEFLDDNNTYRSAIEARASVGTDPAYHDYVPFAWGFYEARMFSLQLSAYYVQQPSTSYVRPAAGDPALYDGFGYAVLPWRARPNRIYTANSVYTLVTAGDYDARSAYIGRTAFHVDSGGWNLQLQGATLEDVTQIVARLK